MNPALYILMRTDMASLTPGKGMAQAAHAANTFIKDAKERGVDVSNWEGSDDPDRQGFGTTIVLGADSYEYMLAAAASAEEDGFLSGVILDSTYPVRDGTVIHHIPVYTCAYAFTSCRKQHPIPALKDVRLY